MEIAPGVYSIGETGFPTAYLSGYSRAYLLDDEETGLTLIDTLADKDGRLILEELRKLRRRPEDLKHILLTHAHRSHIGGLAYLKIVSGATVYSHEWEADIIADKRNPQPVSLWPTPPLKTYTQRVGLALGVGATPCPVNRYLAGGGQGWSGTGASHAGAHPGASCLLLAGAAGSLHGG